MRDGVEGLSAPRRRGRRYEGVPQRGLPFGWGTVHGALVEELTLWEGGGRVSTGRGSCAGKETDEEVEVRGAAAVLHGERGLGGQDGSKTGRENIGVDWGCHGWERGRGKRDGKEELLSDVSDGGRAKRSRQGVKARDLSWRNKQWGQRVSHVRREDKTDAPENPLRSPRPRPPNPTPRAPNLNNQQFVSFFPFIPQPSLAVFLLLPRPEHRRFKPNNRDVLRPATHGELRPRRVPRDLVNRPRVRVLKHQPPFLHPQTTSPSAKAAEKEEGRGAGRTLTFQTHILPSSDPVTRNAPEPGLNEIE